MLSPQISIIFFIVCPPVPYIFNGVVASNLSHSPPYFNNDTVTYVCNDGFAAENDSALENKCIDDGVDSTGSIWLRNAENLAGICRPSNVVNS